MTESKELQVKEKQAVASPSEPTRPGIVFTPDVDIFENDEAITLLADLPGVAPDDVQIDLKDSVLTLAGDVKPFEGADETDLLVEFETGRYFRQFTLSETIDQKKIAARLEDGVLHLNLPKAEKAIPRQIKVTAG